MRNKVILFALFLLAASLLSNAEDICTYNNDCSGALSEAECWNCTSGVIPQNNTTVLFQDVQQYIYFTLNNSRIFVRNCLNFTLHPGYPNASLFIEDSNVTLLGSVSLEELSVSSRSQLFVMDTIQITSNTFRDGATLYLSFYSAFSSPVTRFNGSIILDGPLSWTGDLFFSGTILFFYGKESTIDGPGQWYLQDVQIHGGSYQWYSAPHFCIAVVLSNVTQELGTFLRFRRANITGSSLAISECLDCFFLDCTISGEGLYSIGHGTAVPFEGSTITLGGHVDFPSGIFLLNSTVFSLNGSMVTGRVLDTLYTTLRGHAYWNFSDYSIYDTFFPDEQTLYNATSYGSIHLTASRGGQLHLFGQWISMEFDYRGQINVDEYEYTSGLGILMLSQDTEYTIRKIKFRLWNLSEEKKRRVIDGGRIKGLPQYEISPNCLDYANETVVFTHDTTGLYAQYVSVPFFRRGYVIDGRLHLSREDNLPYECSKNNIHLSIIDGDQKRSLTQMTDGTYVTTSLPDEDGCTRKSVTVSFIDADGHQQLSAVAQILPGLVVTDRRSLWQNFNDTSSFISIVTGEGGRVNMSLEWSKESVEKVGSVCGYAPVALRFRSPIAGLYDDVECGLERQSVLLPANASINHTNPCGTYQVPYVSIVYEKDGERVPSEYNRAGLYVTSLMTDKSIATPAVTLRESYEGTYQLDYHPVNCSCGRFALFCTIFSSNGSLIYNSTVDLPPTISLASGEFTLYTTGACLTKEYYYHTVEAAVFSRTVMTQLDTRPKDRNPSSNNPLPLEWIIPVSVVGGLFVIIAAFLLVRWLRKRRTHNYLEIQ
ncbi:hypothetical protein PROFUN_14062 [Planoprotostelium fungivorum]|uniref:Uncharacterized protein n=1 Tax=Planoprotostelium fungivorum TaxID=1890364 RepID=A0A2P6N1W3_9EUKA|nr:hypothetical protein PROFUN_14062 [Planoprotostelium fungivorum]